MKNKRPVLHSKFFVLHSSFLEPPRIFPAAEPFDRLEADYVQWKA